MNFKRCFIIFISLQLTLFCQQIKADFIRYCSIPPFISAGVKPNVLIILDNSNSMDEDFYGEAVGSYSPASKSVVAKKALRDFINKLKEKLRIGLMTYKLGSVSSQHVHNSPYFVSYDPKSYCPSYSKVCSNNTSLPCENDADCSGGPCVDPCVKYCQTGDSTYKSICEDQCQTGNPSFDIDYFDEIITNYPIGSEQRDRYCQLVYPKTQQMVNPTDTSHYIYYKHAYPMYSSSNLNNAFCYSTDYNPKEGSPYDSYKCYHQKTGTSDDYPDHYTSYWFKSQFVPTDTDYALGYYDFGRRLSWVYIGRTWFSNTSPGNGYLHVAIDDLVDESGNNTSTYTNLWNKLDPKENDKAGYMSCNKSDKNKCDYIINGGLTPTPGTFQSAIDYFTGGDSPIQVRCQQNFIVYVTDGLPSVDKNGNSDTADNLMPTVLSKIDTLRNITKNINGTNYTFNIKTYILGVGLSDEAKTKLDEMAIHGGTDVNGHAYYADNPEELNEALTKIFTNILKQTSSGTSVSILAKRNKKSNIIIQAVFYPEKQFGSGNNSKKLDWIGYLYTWWFYNSSTATNIREDTNENKALDICESDGSEGGDYILDFLLDNDTLKINAYNSKKDGTAGCLAKTYSSLNETYPVWEGGEKLQNKNPDNRIIYTVTGNLQPSTSTDLTELKNLNNTKTIKYSKFFGDEDGDGIIDEDNETTKLISESIPFADLKDFIYGNELTGYRSRKVDNTYTWKLGDIIYSTPKLVEYDDYVVVYVGANDGMLHAFRLGKQRYDGLGPYQEVKLCEDRKVPCNISKLGEERWAFIPKNAMPYLRFLADSNYCHLYYVDLMPYIIELDTNNDKKIDKKILIGGMRLGGGVGCSGTNCVNPPLDTCPSPATYNPATNSCIGLSSYFALDITNSTSPKFLWEFTDPELGFTYSGPAFIKKDSNYYIMFASGPTNYRGESEQELKLFVLQLNSNSTLDNFFTISSIKKIDNSTSSTLSSFNKSFGGRLFTEGIDYNNDGNTDMVFLGTTRQSGGTFHGNILGVKIDDSDPENWDIIKVFNSSIKPITAKIEYSKCFDMNYIYFGTGRYFYANDDPGQNPNDHERLYGVRIDGCLAGGNCNINNAHSASEACDHLDDNNGTVSWYQGLDPKEDQYFKERMIADPTVTDLDVIFFSTTQPTTDVCSFGGRSRMWQLNCATGEDLSNQNCTGYKVDTNRTKGKLFLQLSQGNIEQFTVGTGPTTSFTGPVTPWRPGITPESPTPFISPNISGTGKILLWIEK